MPLFEFLHSPKLQRTTQPHDAQRRQSSQLPAPGAGSIQWVTSSRRRPRESPWYGPSRRTGADATYPWGYAGFRRWLSTYHRRAMGSTRLTGQDARPETAWRSARTLTIGAHGRRWPRASRKALRRFPPPDEIYIVTAFGHSWGSVLGRIDGEERRQLLFQVVHRNRDRVEESCWTL